ALDQVVKTFNESGAGVTIRSQQIPYDPFVDKVTITVPAGTGPDLFIFAHNMVGNWVEKGVLEPLSGLVPPELLKEHMPESVKALVYRKNLYGLPLAFKSLVMFYNKKLLPEPPATMEELIPKLQELKTADRYALVYQAGGLYFHSMWFHAFGGRVFDDEHKPAFDTPEHLKGLEYVRDLHMKHKVLEKGISGFMVTSLFNEGNAVVVFNGPWFLAEIEGPVEYGIAPLPTVEGKPLKPMLGIESVFVTKTSKHKEAALKAAMFLAGAQSAKVRMEVGRQPVTHQATLQEGAKSDDQMRVFMQQFDNSVLMDASPEMQLLWTPGDNAISAGIFVEDRNPKDELKKAQQKMVDAIGAMQK
ncbi:MAG TPA: extracellular solute-binding protein, partial [Myxococcota bacterium]|nr:extracellular solute-binding protein [Myxococcota bacterium]